MGDSVAVMQWRGAMIDLARHFLDRAFLEKTLRSLALFEFNVLHLHLTDDQGWRIEIDSAPKLVEIGSKRARSQINHSLAEPIFDNREHVGFLSKEDARILVSLAQELGIEIVPEINVPGHTGALLAAYPEFGVNQEKNMVTETWGISNNILSPLPATFVFLKEVFSEVASLFPSKYIHVGGDESRIENWLRDPSIVHFMREKNFDNPKEVFNFFMIEVEKIVNDLGKTMITWDDAFAFEPESATNAVVMSWRGPEIAQKALSHARQVIEAPVFPTYFDYSYEVSASEPLAIGGPITVSDVLKFIPNPDSMGVQFQLWTEYIDKPEHAEYMMWPRAAALAYACWSNESDFEEYFAKRKPELEKLGVVTRDDFIGQAASAAGLGIGAFHPGYPIQDMIRVLADSAEEGEIALSFDNDKE